jgi:uncharacterized protein (TIGR02421 family)
VTAAPALDWDPDRFVARVLEELALDHGVDCAVPGGRLHIDRPLPFLGVFRRPADGTAAGADRLVQSLASQLVASGDPEWASSLALAVGRIAGALVERFGSCLVLELSLGGRSGAVVVKTPPDAPATTVPALIEALGRIDLLGRAAAVEIEDASEPAPSGHPPLLTAEDRRRSGALLLVVELPAFFLDEQRRPYPLVLRRLERELTQAMQRAVFDFATVQTSLRPEDFRALGPHRIASHTREVDGALARAAAAIDYLLAVTPVDADLAWREFGAGGRRHEPTFHYRPLTVDPDIAKRDLYAIPIETVEDPTLAALFRAKRHELERQLNLLEDRGSEAFLLTSLQLFGGAEPGLVSRAETILDGLRTRDGLARDDGDHHHVDAEAFAARARAEIEHYRRVDPEIATSVSVRADVPGVLVTGGDLLVGAQVSIPETRVDALIQHEVGTHVVTELNGRAQPLEVLRVGLPGYEETQEGLAVLAEFVAGGLTRSRLITLAARVIAVARLIERASFVETFDELTGRWGLTARRSFHVTMRVYRSGGLTKDAIYLRGLDRLLGHLGGGGSIDPLLAGKLPLHDVPVVEELQWRGVIQPPRLRSRWLEWPGAADRLRRVREGMTVLDLVGEVA